MTAREVFALAVAPIGSGVLQGALMGNFGAFVFGVSAAYVFATVVGPPAISLARHRGWQTFGQTLLVGSCADLASGALLMALVGIDHASASSVLGGVLLLGMHGFVVSMLYWLIAYFGAAKREHAPQTKA